MMRNYVIVEDILPGGDDLMQLRNNLKADNRRRAPDLRKLDMQQDMCVTAYDEQGIMVGGVVGEAELGWLYIDTIWVSSALREQGIGSRLMRAVEQTAYKQGIRYARLITSSFQALPFYLKLGYTISGQNDNRPHGHITYYLMKTLYPEPADLTGLRVDVPLLPSISRSIGQNQVAASPVPIINLPYAVWIKDFEGTILGGVAGGFFWDWYDMRLLWVDERLRGQGVATQLMQRLFAECRRRQANGIAAETMDFQALPFYEKLGFKVLFTLEDYPLGHRGHFIAKTNFES
jgi:GNAT superfamily N-acetyltransferase